MYSRMFGTGKRQTCWKTHRVRPPRRHVAEAREETDRRAISRDKHIVFHKKTLSIFGKSAERGEMCRPWPRSHLNGPSFMLDYRRNFYRSSVLYNAVGGFGEDCSLCGHSKEYNSAQAPLHGCH
ncbi:unnamed protein product, partial [Brenthis ino]